MRKRAWRTRLNRFRRLCKRLRGLFRAFYIIAWLVFPFALAGVSFKLGYDYGRLNPFIVVKYEFTFAKNTPRRFAREYAKSVKGDTANNRFVPNDNQWVSGWRDSSIHGRGQDTTWRTPIIQRER